MLLMEELNYRNLSIVNSPVWRVSKGLKDERMRGSLSYFSQINLLKGEVRNLMHFAQKVKELKEEIELINFITIEQQGDRDNNTK